MRYEKRDWRAPDDLSRSQRRKHQGRYEAAVVPHIADTRPLLSAELLAETEDAVVAITRFDAYVAERLGDGELGPLGAVLLRSESASSSQIENLTVGARQLALAGIGRSDNRNARLVTANVAAMQAALDLADRLDLPSILAMHRALLGGSLPNRAGRWRTEQVWIGGSGAGPHLADFVPPHHERVVHDLADLVQFLDRDDIPVLVQAALGHAQFETIHPFTDGNGRTGRALVHAVLRGKGVTERVTIPVSAGMLTDTNAYFDALGAYRRGDPAPIVEEFARATLAAIGNGRELVDELTGLRRAWGERLAARRDAAAWRLVALLLRQPVVDGRTVQDALGVSDRAALTAIDHLVDAGALVAVDDRARNRVWQAPEVLDALDAFAARAGRRRRAG